jgi:hypothetical protein
MARLQEIDDELAEYQNSYEEAAQGWFRAKRHKEQRSAELFMSTTGTVAERKATADAQTAHIGMEEEAAYEAIKGVVRVLDTRAAIGMALLKAQGRS